MSSSISHNNPLLTSIPLINRVLCFSSLTVKSAVRHSYTCNSWREVVEFYNLELFRTIPQLNNNNKTSGKIITSTTNTQTTRRTSSSSSSNNNNNNNNQNHPDTLWSFVRLASSRNILWLVKAFCHVFDYLHTFNRSVFSRVADALGPLVIACENGFVDIVEFLLALEIFDNDLINDRDIIGVTPLGAACKFGFSDDERKDGNNNNNNKNDDKQDRSNNNNESVLTCENSIAKKLEVRHRKDKILCLLFRHGAYLETKIRSSHDSPFFSAAEKNNDEGIEMMKFLLVDAPNAISHADSIRLTEGFFGSTCLMYSVCVAADRSVKFVLEDLPTKFSDVAAVKSKTPRMEQQSDSKQQSIFLTCLLFSSGSGSVGGMPSSKIKNEITKKDTLNRYCVIMKTLVAAHQRQIGIDAPIITSGVPRWKLLSFAGETWNSQKFRGGSTVEDMDEKKINLAGSNLVSFAAIEKNCPSVEMFRTVVQSVHKSLLRDVDSSGLNPMLRLVYDFLKEPISSVLSVLVSTNHQSRSFSSLSLEEKKESALSRIRETSQKCTLHPIFDNMMKRFSILTEAVCAGGKSNSEDEEGSDSDDSFSALIENNSRVPNPISAFKKNPKLYRAFSSSGYDFFHNIRPSQSTDYQALMIRQSPIGLMSAPIVCTKSGCNVFHLLFSHEMISDVNGRLFEKIFDDLMHKMNSNLNNNSNQNGNDESDESDENNEGMMLFNLFTEKCGILGKTPLHYLLSMTSLIDEEADLVAEEDDESCISGKNNNGDLMLMRSQFLVFKAEAHLDLVKSVLAKIKQVFNEKQLQTLLLSQQQSTHRHDEAKAFLSSKAFNLNRLPSIRESDKFDTFVGCFVKTFDVSENKKKRWIITNDTDEDLKMIAKYRSMVFEEIVNCFGRENVMENLRATGMEAFLEKR